MTTQTSPFQETIDADKATETLPEFSFQTMQDDLLSIQNKSVIKEEAPAPKTTPPPSSTPKPFDPATISSSKISSFSNQTQPKKNITEIPTSALKNDHPETKSAKYKILLSLIIVLTIGVIGTGAYYFLTSRAPKQVAAQPAIETPTAILPAEDPVVIAAPVEKYSINKPNYLVIDPATSSDIEIKATISSVADELKNLSSQSPYEFIIVDANNNPVAFPIFATAAKLNLSPIILTSLGENFSLFVYNDNGNTRLGFSVATSKTPTVVSELQKQEKTLVTDLSFLFINAIPEIKNGSFNTSVYNGSIIRYFNVNQQKDLSIDYAVKDSQLIIASSKNTERAILDKLSTKTMSDTNIQPQDNSSTNLNINTQATDLTDPNTEIPSTVPVPATVN